MIPRGSSLDEILDQVLYQVLGRRHPTTIASTRLPDSLLRHSPLMRRHPNGN